ncbi:MAG: amino acid ABC transporter permease [Candidatus Nucleicultricaceae bacterium]
MDFSFLLVPVITGENSTYLGWVLSGMIYTSLVSLSAFFIAVIVGILVGTLKTTTGIKKHLATFFFEVTRAIPLIAQMFIAYFVIPQIFFPEWIKTADPMMFTLWTSIISLGIFMSGRISAQIYGAINALPRSQTQAAKALGFVPFQTYRYFLLPQALRNIVPTLTSEALNTVKNSAVASTIGLFELSKQAQRIIDYTAKPYEAFMCIILGYLIINCIVLVLIKTIDRMTQLSRS